MSLMENINWLPDEPLQGGNEYVNEVIIFLETLVSTAQQILPVQVLKRVLRDVLSHISEKIVGALVNDPVKRFNVNAVMGIDIDIRLLETFAENPAGVLSDDDASQLKQALAEKVVIVSEKLKDPADRSFFRTRGTRQNVKQKSLDTLIKRLKEHGGAYLTLTHIKLLGQDLPTNSTTATTDTIAASTTLAAANMDCYIGCHNAMSGITAGFRHLARNSASITYESSRNRVKIRDSSTP
ncbi:Exocyst complex component SEC15B-like protein, partial [Drosera capensis]